VANLSLREIGQSCVGIGGDPVVGMNFNEVLIYANRRQAVVMIGEIGERRKRMWPFMRDRFPKLIFGFYRRPARLPGKTDGSSNARRAGRWISSAQDRWPKGGRPDCLLHPVCIGEKSLDKIEGLDINGKTSLRGFILPMSWDRFLRCRYISRRRMKVSPHPNGCRGWRRGRISSTSGWAADFPLPHRR
jgi:hypothetical protein